MPKQSAAKPDDALMPLERQFAVPLDELPCLQVFGLPFDSEGEVKVRITFALPADRPSANVPEHQSGNRGLVKINCAPDLIEIATQKIWGLSWDFFGKQFGQAFARFLHAPPAGTVLTVTFSSKKGTQAYRGTIAGNKWQWDATFPAVPLDVIESAWQVARRRFDKAICCADAAEADAIVVAAGKDKFLRSMSVEREGLAISCRQDEGHLAALLFQHRFGSHWHLPELAAKKRARPDAMETALETWRAKAAPTPAALAGFEFIRNLLAESAAGIKLSPQTQEFPPKYELRLPPAGKREHEWEFASVAAMGDDVYFELYPLGLDVALRDQVSKSLRQQSFRPDDGFRLAGDGAPFHDEIRALVVAAQEWFAREIVALRPLPPCQLLDHYLIEPVAWLRDADLEKEPGFESLARQASHRPFDHSAQSFVRRLKKVLGPGDWRRAELELTAMLPGWKKPCRLEVHWYDRREGREAWKIKRFLKGQPVEATCDGTLRYLAAAELPASLARGKIYRCTARLGRKFQAYVRVVDESGEEYWYPERFFVPVPAGRRPS